MLQALSEWVQLAPELLVLIIFASFFAGLMRGFTGFGLSAVLMASMVSIIPPVELIPVAFYLEAMASIILLRGGVRDANMKIVWGLIVFSTLGFPVGLYLTIILDPEISKAAALMLILGLTLLQLAQIKSSFLASQKGLYATGLFAGMVSGLASVGGMVIALFVLSRHAPAKEMRASLVVYLFFGVFTSLVVMSLYQVMTWLALQRALVLMPTTLMGLMLGAFLFRPSLVPFYKQICLIMLLVLCTLGLYRLYF